jgi:Putative amidoligase enzyme
MSTVASTYSPCFTNEEVLEARHFIAGTEYEIEEVRAISFPGYEQGYEFPEKHAHWFGDLGIMLDHSLRNNGLEFVTRPVSYNDSLRLFQELHNGLKVGPNAYSPRTSTHVHVNVCSMPMDKLRHMMLLYALLEPAFFSFAGDKRKHNIHCVPLNYTLLPAIYDRNITYLIETWSKYSAFNLMPVRNIGTVEFRHLYGTGDFNIYKQWLTLLKELWTFAFNEDATCLEEMLFEGWSPHKIQLQVMPSSHFIVPSEEDYQRSLIDVKLAFI